MGCPKNSPHGTGQHTTLAGQTDGVQYWGVGGRTELAQQPHFVIRFILLWAKGLGSDSGLTAPSLGEGALSQSAKEAKPCSPVHTTGHLCALCALGHGLGPEAGLAGQPRTVWRTHCGRTTQRPPPPQLSHPR